MGPVGLEAAFRRKGEVRGGEQKRPQKWPLGRPIWSRGYISLKAHKGPQGALQGHLRAFCPREMAFWPSAKRHDARPWPCTKGQSSASENAAPPANTVSGFVLRARPPMWPCTANPDYRFAKTGWLMVQTVRPWYFSFGWTGQKSSATKVPRKESGRLKLKLRACGSAPSILEGLMSKLL